VGGEPTPSVFYDPQMFIGHFALAYAAKRVEPSVSVGISMAAAQLAVVLFVIYLASSLGPPPPSPRAAALSAAPMVLLALWGGWADRHRATVR
jgi:hypothetical protein